jgi:hypothetical protein
MTGVEYLYENILLDPLSNEDTSYNTKVFEKAYEMEKENTDNKVIHFAEWLTKKHTTVLMTLYEQFEEQYYNEEL